MLERSRRLDQDYRKCEQIIKEHSKSFYYAFSQLPKLKSRAVYAIYAFCRLADDAVDYSSSRTEAIKKLHEIKTKIKPLTYSGHQKFDEPVLRALADVFDRYQITIDAFYDQLRGQEMDIMFSQPKNLSQLEYYSEHVAGSVGRMLLPILASNYYKEHGMTTSMVDFANQLGIAMQVTNILRDIGEDYHQLGRVYLPKDLMVQFNYQVNDLKAQLVNQNFIDLWEYLAQRAEDLYSRVLHSIELLDDDSKKQVLISAKVYKEILNVIRENDYKVFDTKHYVPNKRKIKISSSVL